MAEVPKASSSADQGGDMDSMIRLSMSPAPAHRPKRSVSGISVGSSSAGSDSLPCAEELLTQTLLAIEGDEVSYDVFQFAIEMLEDISKHYIPGQSCKDIFGVIFALLLKAVPPIQARAVATINQLITSNPGIIQFTKDTEWLSELLSFLPRFEDASVLDELFKMIEILGSYHISVKQVKMIFKLFQVEDTAFKSYYWQNIFPLLQRLWHGRDGRPNDYFELDGYHSGLLLPPLKLPGGGYSIATWVYVSSFTSNYMRETYQPYLFSFLTEDGTCGIEAHFNRGKLILRTNPQHSNTSKRELRIVNYEFSENRWYFIALTHTKKLILSDECNVYVNGESIQHFNLKYPKPDQALKSSRLGTAGLNPEPKSCMRGQMAGFLAFDDTLNADEVRALYHHGPNLFSSLKPLEQLVLMPRSRLARRPNVLFFYSPRATDCSVCLEPWSNDTTRRANMLPGVRTCITTGFQDSLSSVGGIQLLLPLFSSKYRPSSAENVDVNTKVLSLLIELVTDNEEALTEMWRSRFFQIMGYLLATDYSSTSTTSQSTHSQHPASSGLSASATQLASLQDGNSSTSHPMPTGTPQPDLNLAPSHERDGNATLNPNTAQGSGASTATKGKPASNKWSPQSIEVLDRLALAVSRFGASSGRSRGPLFEQFFRHVYLNFHIWAAADYEVQLALLKSINTHVKSDPELFHGYFSVVQLMTVLNEHFTLPMNIGVNERREKMNSAVVSGGSSMAVVGVRSGSYGAHLGSAHGGHGSVSDWSKRPRGHLVEVRKALLGTLHCFIQVGISLKETKAIINYLHHEVASKSEERRMITDVLQVLLISIGERHASLLHHLNTMGNLLVFLPLLKSDTEKYRVWTLKVIGKLLQNADSDPSQKESIIAHLPSLRKVLEPYPLTIHTYNVLLEILIDNVSADGLINPVDFALHPSTPSGSALTNLKNLKMISVIFQLLNARSTTELRIKVLKDFLFYLKRGTENRSKFTSQHDWQAWLLSLLVPDQPPVPISATGGALSHLHHSSSSGAVTGSSHAPSSSGSLIPVRRHRPIPTLKQSANSNGSSSAASSNTSSSLNVTEAAAHNVLLGLVTETFSLLFETALLQGSGGSSIFEGTAAVLRRMASIQGFDAISIANTINTKVLKMMVENNIVAKCKANPATFQICVQYLTFVESTFFRAPPQSAQIMVNPQTPTTGSGTQNLSASSSSLPRDVPSVTITTGSTTSSSSSSSSRSGSVDRGGLVGSTETSSNDSSISSSMSPSASSSSLAVNTSGLLGTGISSSGPNTPTSGPNFGLIGPHSARTGSSAASLHQKGSRLSVGSGLSAGMSGIGSQSGSLSSVLVSSSSLGSIATGGSHAHGLASSAGATAVPAFGEKDSIRYGDRPLLPLYLHYGSNGSWLSFTLAQRILELVDQLIVNKVERSPTMEIAPELLDRLEAALSRFRTRLVLYSIAEGATFKSTTRLRLRKESIRNIRQIVHDGFSGSQSKSFGDLPSGGVQASLGRYLQKKAKQWDTEMSDVDSMFHKNIKRVRALLESTPSNQAALYLVAYIGALVQKANASPQNAGVSNTTTIPESLPSPAPSAPLTVSNPIVTPPAVVSQPVSVPKNTASSDSSAAIINSIFAPVSSPKAVEVPSQSSQNAISAIFSPPSSPISSQNASHARTESQSVQHTDESVQLTQQLWRDAIQNIRQRLSADSNYGAMFSKLEGEVLWSFFESGLASPKDFVLSPAIEKAIDFIVTNDLNALTAQQNAMKTVSERYTDLTQNETMQELELHKAYEREWNSILMANTIATKENSERYAIRYSEYISIIASDWKNLLRVLLDTRGPWSSPYSSYRDEIQPDSRELALSSQMQHGYRPNEKMYWKLDSTENSQRMRLKMKRHYGDTSILEYASAKNDEKERQMMESLTSSNSSLMSPTSSMSSLPPFELPSSSSSSISGGQQHSNNLSRADLLKLVARRGGNATALDDDDTGMIDTEYGVGDGTGGDEGGGSGVGSVGSGGSQSQVSSSSSASPGSTSGSTSSVSSNKFVEERTLLLTTCDYVKGISKTFGDFEVTTTHIYFRNLERGVFKIIPLEKLRAIYSRRYMLQNTALELFTTDRTSHFFNFDKESPAKVLKIITDRRPVNLREYFSGSSYALARKKKHITEAWRKRQISNFEYLMELNTIAGRSYNDLSQYPVFPWIIADYESERLDLNNPSIYRDLSKPIGALDPIRLEKFLARWDEMVKNSDEQMNSTPPFLYGSHYSSHSIVLYYLIRLEPFTTQSLELQGGQFDLPARLFTSISESWRNCLINQSDVKELIPEFFYLPSFLNDTNDINLGCMKPTDGSTSPISIDTVELPPWAPSAQAFIQMNRLALESEYVSAHLHEWIDLIFGFKQLGQEAIDAHNVFYYTSYEGNIDIESITDPMLKQSVQMQIREFGQTPSQLFTSAHPARLTLEESQKAKRNALAALVVNALSGAGTGEAEIWKPTTADLAKTVALSFRPNTVANAEIVSIHVDTKNERFILVFMDGLVQTVNWKIPRGKRFPLQMTPQWSENDIINNSQKKEEHSLENTASAPGLNPSQACFVYLDNQSKVLINAGSWDRSITISMVSSTLATLQNVSEHKDIVTCLAATQDCEYLISASRDCNVLVWDIASSFALKKKVESKDAAPPKPKFVLFGHDDAINCVAVNADLNVIVTASQDCTSIVYDLRKGRYIRTIVHDSPVTLVAVSKFGDIVTYCTSGEILSLHTVNGTLLKRINGVGKLSTLKFSADGQLLVTSGQNIITVRSLFQYSLKRIYLWKCPTAVSSIELFNQDEYLLIGLCDGSLLTVIFDMNKVLTDMSREMAMEKQD